MSQEGLEQFMGKVESNDELKVTIESQLDSDGTISADTLIALGAEHGCEFTAEDLAENAELSDDELDGVAGGFRGTPRNGELKSRPWFSVRFNEFSTGVFVDY